MIRNRQIYECQICGSLVEVRRQGGGGLWCCGAPLKFRREDGMPASPEHQGWLDLTEIVINGRSSWQFIQPGAAAAASA